MKDSYNDLFNLNPKYTSSIAFILGMVLTSDLDAYEQNVLGNWLILLGQTIITNAAAQNLIEGRIKGGIININSNEVKSCYNPIIYDINKAKEIIDKVYPDNNMDVHILKNIIENLNKRISELEKK